MMSENLSAFFNEFSKDIYYTPIGFAHLSNKTRVIATIPDSYTYESMEGIQTTKNVYLVQESDVLDVTEGAKVQDDGINYVVREYPKNGDGLRVLITEKSDL